MDAAGGVVEEHLGGLRGAIQRAERAGVGGGADRKDRLRAAQVEGAAGLGDDQVAAGLEGRGAGSDHLIMLRARGEAPDFDVERAGFDVVSGDRERAGGVARSERTEVGQAAGDRDGAAEAVALEDADRGGERAVDDELAVGDGRVTRIGVRAGEGQRARAVLPETTGAADGARGGRAARDVEDAARAGEGHGVGDGPAVGDDAAAVGQRHGACTGADVGAGTLVEGDELAAFDEGGGVGAGGGGVVLGGDEEPLAAGDAVVHDRRDVDDAGVLFVEGLEINRARGEASAIRFEDLDGALFAEGLGAEGRVDDPVLGHVGAVTRVFLDVEHAVVADRQVVEAAGLLTVQAGDVVGVDEDPDIAAGGEDAVGRVAVEVELVDLRGDGGASHRAAAGAGGGHDQGVMVEPVGVFRAGELGHAETERFGLELGAGLGRDGRIGEDRSEREGAVDAGGVLERDGAGIPRDTGVHLDAVELAVREAGSFDGVAGVGLSADIDVDFAGRGIVRADDDGLEEVGGARSRSIVGTGEQVLVRVLAVVREFVGLADFIDISRRDEGEGLAFGAGFFAVQEDAAIVAGAGASIIEGVDAGEVGGAGAEVGVGGGGSSPGGAVPHHLVEARGDEVAARDDLPGRGVDDPLGNEAAGRSVGTDGSLEDAGREIIPDLMVGEDGHGAVAVVVCSETVGDAGHQVAADRVAHRE